MAMWIPDLAGRAGPKYRQIVEAMADAVASGALRPGDRLPPHRELAFQLGVSPNTTSRAYAEGVARALLSGEVGRGTFVRPPGGGAEAAAPLADMRRPEDGPINLARNLPTPGLGARALGETLASLGAGGALAGLVDFQSEGDAARQAGAGVEWLARAGVAAHASEIVTTIGAQHGILSALMATTRPGDLLLTEELAYAPVRAMADRLGLRRKSIAMDADGVLPEALEEACRTSAPRALYLTPTLQTPTATVMSAARRDAIAEIALRHGLVILEDDVFGVLLPDPPSPIADRAPDSTIYLASVSKCLGPGLRVGFARAPAALADAMRGAVSLSCWMAPPLMVEIVGRWLADGTADRLTRAQRAAAARRQALAREILGGADLTLGGAGLHAWLRLPSSWSGDAFRAEAGRRGVMVVDASAFADADARPEPAIRLCLTHEASEDRLRQGLTTLRSMLDGMPTATSLVL